LPLRLVCAKKIDTGAIAIAEGHFEIGLYIAKQCWTCCMMQSQCSGAMWMQRPACWTHDAVGTIVFSVPNVTIDDMDAIHLRAHFS
jgi:hypothetical protein